MDLKYPSTLNDEVIQVCQQLISIPSFNPPGNELEIATFALDYLKNAGLQTEIIEHTPQRASLMARLPGNGNKKPLLFSAHMDTVVVGAEQWVYPPYIGKLTEDKIWGRGAADMKGGMAAMLIAAKAVANMKTSLEGDLILAFSAGEEVNMLGAKTLVNRPEMHDLQAMIVGEPTSNDLVIAEKGVLWLEVTTKGKTAHGSMPEYGQNAINMMLSFINAFNKLQFPYVEHPLLGKFSRSLNTINGGIQTNIVPDQCVVTIDMRTVPGQNHDEMLQQIKELIQNIKTQNPDFSASIRVMQDGHPLTCEPDNIIVKTMNEIIDQVTGQKNQPKGVRYFTDGAIYATQVKAPLIICGPGQTELAHQPNEFVEINKLTQAAQIYTLAAMELLK